MNLEIALIHGLIWSFMWGSMSAFIIFKWPYMVLHDYPKELQEIIELPEFTNKKSAYIYSLYVLEYI